MIFENTIFYQGPGNRSAVHLGDGDILKNCEVRQVGWSLFRKLIPLEWSAPMVIIEGGNITIEGNVLIGKRSVEF